MNVIDPIQTNNDYLGSYFDQLSMTCLFSPISLILLMAENVHTELVRRKFIILSPQDFFFCQDIPVLFQGRVLDH